MAQDWSADVKKYAPDADDSIIAGIVRHCGIALHKVDSALVSFSDPAETGRVREGFLKKNLALTQPDSELDAAIARVGETMKDDRTKNRVTVYYLLAEAFGQLELFRKAPAIARAKAATADSAMPAAAAATAAAVVGAGALLPEKGAARSTMEIDPPADPVIDQPYPVVGEPIPSAAAVGLDAPDNTSIPSEPLAEPVAIADGPPAAPPVVATDPVMPAGRRDRYITTPDEPAVETRDDRSMGWLPWLLLGLGVLALLWYFLIHRPHERAEDVAPVAAAPAPEPATMTTTNTVSTSAAAPSAATAVTIPTGAGVTSETRDGKPAVDVYFDTGKSVVVPAFAGAADALKIYLGANAGAKLAVSGYNDKTGNAALNAELSKNRAKAVQAALVAAGVPATSIELAKPAETTDTTTSNDRARRVEVTVK